ncbi:WG repeat-containing protein [Leptolyngbya cf. ectocarpi LEGE 11479]|uniref:WG repeat-containing protein n=1 Tax=Leptolyngbya cf. ectocarpi LEGE 11479 TaxID=1828722 RepID=A0A928ZUD3_LEPEC|nr:WG repeat-containing protein [Leptolyngbya ectocarpi]MBE9067631.1 WG repeat-containing protein [Leptolyngbya cf. ectocarpi LEGE 11479]
MVGKFVRSLSNSLWVGLSAAIISTLPATAQTFADTQQHWAKGCIERLAADNKLNGYPDGSFRPQNSLTRAEFAVLMLNSFPGVRTQTTTVPNFADVSSQHWAKSAIATAYQKRIFVGYPDNTFRPNQPIARVEALAILSTLIPTDYQDRPRGLAVPPEADTVLNGFLQDGDQTPAWAQDQIAAAAAGFLIVDYPHGQQLRPQAASSRADIAAFLCQSFGWDGLVPMAAVAGNQHFDLSPAWERLQRARSQGQHGWFDPQQQLAIIATAPADWIIVRLKKTQDNRVATLFQASDGRLKWGYFDEVGTIAIAPQFDTAGHFSEGLAPVSNSGQYGFVDPTGNLTIPLQFDAAQPFSEGLAAVRVDNQWGFIDPTGAWVIAPQPHAASPFSEGLARIEVPGESRWQRQYGFIDRTGQQVIAPTLAGASHFSEGLAAAVIGTTEQRYGYIDKTGTWVIQGLSQMGGDFSEGLAAVQQPSEQRINSYDNGYINRDGQWVILPQRFLETFGDQPLTLGKFVNGFASLQVGQTIGFINRQGTLVVPPKFSDIQSMTQGYAQVNYGGIWVDYVGGYDGTASPVLERRLESGRWGYVRLLD